MKGPDSACRYVNGTYELFRNIQYTIRRVLCTKYLTNEPHYLRFRSVFDKLDAEFMFDYIELCPTSIYDSEEGEDTH